MIMLIIGMILNIIGILCLYKSSLTKDFYKKIKNGTNKEYKKTIGVVICEAYEISSVAEINKMVTPIVEYEVEGEIYEAQNPVLKIGGELPVGTKVYVWYKKNNPKIAVLGTELESYKYKKMIGILLIVFGIMFIFLNI